MGKPGPEPKVTPSDISGVLMDRDDTCEPVTAPEVADLLDVSRRTALNVLHDMEDQDEIASKKVGGRARVWWLPNTTE